MIYGIIVSPDAELRRWAESALSDMPLKLTLLPSLREAGQHMRNEIVQIAIVDLFLGPDTSGFDALKLLKKNEQLVFILLSRLKGRGLLERAFRYGASDTLVYPMEADTLRQTVLHRLQQIGEAVAVTMTEQSKTNP